jgi:drug/metabolite transporter (DMT)-like permease
MALLWVAAAWAFGQILVQASVRRISAARSAAFLLLNPLTATALAVVVLGELLSATQVAGAVLVLVGIALSAEVDAAVRSLLAEGRRRSESTRSA